MTKEQTAQERMELALRKADQVISASYGSNQYWSMLSAAIVKFIPELVEIDEEKAVFILWGKFPDHPEDNKSFQNMCTQMNILYKANPIKVRG